MFEVVPVTGQDVNRDGAPELVLEAFSGGAHCCWTYYIVTLGTTPQAVALENQTGVGFERDSQGQYVLHAGDGSFDYFDDLSHAVTVFPDVFLQLDRSVFRDVSSAHWPTFQQRIDNARKRLTPESLARFRDSSGHDFNLMETKSEVLEIVLEYLYGGKSPQAWREFDSMWPIADQDRMRQLIAATRAKGILGQVGALGGEDGSLSSPRADVGQSEEAVRSLLNQWVDSFKQKDLLRQVDCYAPQVDTYYRKHNVSQAFVQDNKSRAFSAISEIRQFELSNISITFDSPSDGSITFDKSWDTTLSSGKRYAGSEMERLRVALIDGSWRIKREEELKLYNVTH
jgi:hypothetical protein